MWLADRLWVRANSKKPAEPGHSPTPDSARTHTLSNKDIIYTYQIKIKKTLQETVGKSQPLTDV